MHISRLVIAGVRGFHESKSVDLNFKRPDGSTAGWTVLAGRNGSGKSTILQALGMVLAGPQATGTIPSLGDWISRNASSAHVEAVLEVSAFDNYQPVLGSDTNTRVWMDFKRPPRPSQDTTIDLPEPEITGEGINSFATKTGTSSVRSQPSGWFYAGYGPFRHLGATGAAGSWRLRRSTTSKRTMQVASLFDETLPLSDAVDWLVEQRLLQYEKRASATRLIDIVTTLLSDGLLPDGFRVSKVTSDGLWISTDESEFLLRDMSDGYRAITALVVDIVRQMYDAYAGGLKLTHDSGVSALSYPGVVLVDEIDAHLHVSWQKEIGDWLKSHFPMIQFIVSTHSPYICQSADPGGLILLPGPRDEGRPQILDGDLYDRVVYGSGDDAILSALFGVSSPYSHRADQLRRRLGQLEVRILDGSASESERSEYKSLSEMLSSSLSTRVDEMMTRLERLQ